MNDEGKQAQVSPLRARILAGDVKGVMDLIDAMTPAERAASFPVADEAAHERWEKIRDVQIQKLNVRQPFDAESVTLLFRAMAVGLFMTNPERELSDYWKHVRIEDIALFRQRYGALRANPPTGKELHGDHRWHYAHTIHRAVIAGLVERPQTEEYLQSLFFNYLNEESNVILRHVDADPGMAPYLLELFDREGPSDASFATSDQYVKPELTWRHAFLTLCERGVYTRDQLLDKTLSTLASDWPQFKANWFSQFHDALAPTLEEKAARAARYLALCHSRIGPTVTLALGAVSLLYKAGHVHDDQLCEALEPVITSPVKARVLAALALLGLMVKKSPQHASRASAMAAHALAHTAADVQKKVMACLQNWGAHEAGLEVARTYLPFVAAVNQPALISLTGAAVQPSLPVKLCAAPHPLTPLSPLDPSRVVQPLTAIDDLIERIAYVLENPADVDEWERAADALVRMAPVVRSEQAAFMALKKRGARLDWEARPMAFAIARLMEFVLDGAADGVDSMVEHPGYAPTMEPLIALRVRSLIDHAALGASLSPLAAPTHIGGFIDPRVLAARIAAFEQAGIEAPLSEQVFALMRLVPASVDTDAARAAVNALRELNDRPLIRALRYALGDAVSPEHSNSISGPLFMAAARIRAVGGDTAAPPVAEGPVTFTPDWRLITKTYDEGKVTCYSVEVMSTPELPDAKAPHYDGMLFKKHLSIRQGRTERYASNIRFAATLCPTNLEAFFTEGVFAMGNNVNWGEALWQARVYLDVLLLPTTPMTPTARTVLALGLFGKEPGQGALAVDVLVNSVKDGRLNHAAFVQTLARLWATPLVKGPRLASRLSAAVQADACMPAAVFKLLCDLLELDDDAARKDKAALLELLLELKLSQRLALPDSTATALARMTLSGKSKLARQCLLA